MLLLVDKDDTNQTLISHCRYMLDMIIDLKVACHCTLVNHLHQQNFDSETAADLSNY